MVEQVNLAEKLESFSGHWAPRIVVSCNDNEVSLAREQADAWRVAGVDAGVTSIGDRPGVRESDFGDLYLASLRDPGGSKICAYAFTE